MIKTIIFDFDGVIADGLAIATASINTVGSKFKIPKITQEDIRTIGMHGLVIKSKLSSRQFISLLQKVKKEMNKNMARVNPIEGIEAVLEVLSSKYNLGILTANSRDNLFDFLERNNLKRLFKFAYTDSAPFSKDKLLKKLCKAEKLELDEIICVGDEEGDIIAAKKLKVPIVAVLWGYESKDLLERLHPDYIAKKPSDLVQIMTSKN